MEFGEENSEALSLWPNYILGISTFTPAELIGSFDDDDDASSAIDIPGPSWYHFIPSLNIT